MGVLQRIVLIKLNNRKRRNFSYQSVCVVIISLSLQCHNSLSLSATVLCMEKCLSSILCLFWVSSTCMVGHQICLIQPSPNMSSVTILVILCQKKNSGSYSPLLPRLKFVHAPRHTFVCAPPPLLLPVSLLHTHASTHSARFIIHLPTQHSVPETDSIDAKLPVPAGSVPLKHWMHLPKLG